MLHRILGRSGNNDGLFYSSSTSTFYIRSSGTNYPITSSIPLNLGEVYSVRFVRRGAEIELFVNGVHVGTNTTTTDSLVIDYI
ncbi:MAG: hypothetical protein H6546_07035 [Chitinophagales bacterium]|nr:hypothetical protein [Chitinophagales bacterium]